MLRLFALHGFTGAPSSWSGVLAALQSRAELSAPWLTGHGSPPAALEVDGFEAEVTRLSALLPEGELVLAGYSLGARLALALLARHPERFRAAVLVSGRAAPESDEERHARLRSDEALAERLEAQGLEAFVDAWEAEPLFATQRALPAPLRAEERARRTAHRAAGLAHSLCVTGLGRMPNLDAALARVSTPVELLAGELDVKFCRLAEAVVGKVRRARVERVAAAGHNLLLERPEAVARALFRGLSA